MIRLVAFIVLLLTGHVAVSADAPPASPVSLKVELVTDEIGLQTDGLPVHKFEEKIRLCEKEGAHLPPTLVEMVLVFRNNSNETVRMLVDGDDTLLSFELTGGETVTAEVNVPQRTRIASRVVTLPPGGTFRLKHDDLSHGFRKQSKLTYLTTIGLYKLQATYRTVLSPAVGTDSTPRKGFGTVILKAEPVEFWSTKAS